MEFVIKYCKKWLISTVTHTTSIQEECTSSYTLFLMFLFDEIGFPFFYVIALCLANFFLTDFIWSNLIDRFYSIKIMLMNAAIMPFWVIVFPRPLTSFVMVIRMSNFDRSVDELLTE